MISLKSEFRYLKRGFKETLVLVPGWAVDEQIFNPLALDYNYLLATKLYPFNFNQVLLEQLEREKLSKVSIFGFSLGGFLACDFADKYPDKIAELILVSIRKKYESEALTNIQRQLQKNKQAYLYKFYISCFSRADLEGINWFKKYLLRQYIDNLKLNELSWGLDYLASHQIQAESLSGIKRIRIFHGLDDTIAPLDEALELKSKLMQAEFIYLKDLGHFPFLNQQFRIKFYYG